MQIHSGFWLSGFAANRAESLWLAVVAAKLKAARLR